jgi:transcriptional regulator with XRE-family HTH domain
MSTADAPVKSNPPPLRAVREFRGMSLRELARRAQLDPTFLGRVERGEEGLSIASLERITRVLGERELADRLRPWVRSND